MLFVFVWTTQCLSTNKNLNLIVFKKLITQGFDSFSEVHIKGSDESTHTIFPASLQSVIGVRWIIPGTNNTWWRWTWWFWNPPPRSFRWPRRWGWWRWWPWRVLRGNHPGTWPHTTMPLTQTTCTQLSKCFKRGNMCFISSFCLPKQKVRRSMTWSWLEISIVAEVVGSKAQEASENT